MACDTWANIPHIVASFRQWDPTTGGLLSLSLSTYQPTVRRLSSMFCIDRNQQIRSMGMLLNTSIIKERQG